MVLFKCSFGVLYTQNLIVKENKVNRLIYLNFIRFGYCTHMTLIPKLYPSFEPCKCWNLNRLNVGNHFEKFCRDGR